MINIIEMNDFNNSSRDIFLEKLQLNHNEKSVVPIKNTITLDDAIELNRKNIAKYSLDPIPISYIDYIDYPYNAMSYSDLISLINDSSVYEMRSDYFSTSTAYLTKATDIEFSSKFESGNLRMALEVSENEYDLLIRPEIKSFKTYHWFFFSVRLKTRPKQNAFKFNIINMTKQQVLFNDDVRLLSYYDDNWSRDTFNIHYFQNGLTSTSEAVFNTLTFSFDFSVVRGPDKVVYFAYCFPYTYTQLCLYLKSLVCSNKILQYEIIGKSLNGNEITMLIITDFNDNFDTVALKPAIFLTGRVHPGESNSSFIVEGLIQFLLSNHPSAVQLRKIFIFKIIPMLNPDGVMLGNFRMNTQGKDLNRMWMEPTLETSPTIVYSKNSIVKTLNSRNIYLFCDFHGHSRKSNFFLYCCKWNTITNNQLKGMHITNTERKKLKSLNEHHEMVLPYILHKENNMLDKSSCTNKIHPSKVKTARAVLKMEFNVDLSYCLESSIASIRLQNGELIPFTMELYRQIGRDFCLSIVNLINKKIFSNTLSLIRIEKAEQLLLKKDKKRKLLPPISITPCQFSSNSIHKKKTINGSNIQANSVLFNDNTFINTNNINKHSKQGNPKKNGHEFYKFVSLLNNYSNEFY